MFSLLSWSSSSKYLKMAAGIHPGAPADDFYNEMGGVFPQRCSRSCRRPSPRSGGGKVLRVAGRARKHRLRAFGPPCVLTRGPLPSSRRSTKKLPQVCRLRGRKG